MTTASQITEAIKEKFGHRTWEINDFFEELVNGSQYLTKGVHLPDITEPAIYVESWRSSNLDSYGYRLSDELWVIFKVGDKYFKKEGYSSSYGGDEWDGSLYEVTLEERPVVERLWHRS